MRMVKEGLFKRYTEDGIFLKKKLLKYRYALKWKNKIILKTFWIKNKK